jgi:putative oxidoreductase
LVVTLRQCDHNEHRDIVQVLLAAAFLMAGLLKTFRYEQAKQQMGWVEAVPRGSVLFIGAVEILGAIGLVLPVLTRILPWLTPLAAVGLALDMFLAGGFHALRREYAHILPNLVPLALAVIIVFGRWSLLA